MNTGAEVSFEERQIDQRSAGRLARNDDNDDCEPCATNMLLIVSDSLGPVLSRRHFNRQSAYDGFVVLVSRTARLWIREGV